MTALAVEAGSLRGPVRKTVWRWGLRLVTTTLSLCGVVALAFSAMIATPLTRPPALESIFTTARTATVRPGACSRCTGRLRPPACAPFYRSMGLQKYELPLMDSSPQLLVWYPLANSRPGEITDSCFRRAFSFAGRSWPNR